jgi:hypothetical protein
VLNNLSDQLENLRRDRQRVCSGIAIHSEDGTVPPNYSSISARERAQRPIFLVAADNGSLTPNSCEGPGRSRCQCRTRASGAALNAHRGAAFARRGCLRITRRATLASPAPFRRCHSRPVPAAARRYAARDADGHADPRDLPAQSQLQEGNRRRDGRRLEARQQIFWGSRLLVKRQLTRPTSCPS